MISAWGVGFAIGNLRLPAALTIRFPAPRYAPMGMSPDGGGTRLLDSPDACIHWSGTSAATAGLAGKSVYSTIYHVVRVEFKRMHDAERPTSRQPVDAVTAKRPSRFSTRVRRSAFDTQASQTQDGAHELRPPPYRGRMPHVDENLPISSREIRVP